MAPVKDYKHYNPETYAVPEYDYLPSKYYTPSGKISPLGLIYMPLFGSMAAFLGGAAYGWGSYINPFEAFTFIISFIFGFILGLGVSFGVTAGKVRSPMLASFFGLITGVLGVYVQWVAWVHFFYAGAEEPLNVWIFNPLELGKNIVSIGNAGAWQIFGWTPSGLWLYIAWILEALLILLLSVTIADGSARYTPFCEHCGEWAESVFDSPLKLGPVQDKSQFRYELESGNYDVLEGLGAPGEKERSEVQLHRCKKCLQIGYLKVKLVKDGPDKRDQASGQTEGAANTEYVSEDVVDNLIIDAAGIEKVIALKEKMAPGEEEVKEA